MNTVILYIKDTYGVYQRADMFKDETISVTSKVKDVKDISKVFTDFSQSFTLPASKENNKTFAHFNRYDIVGGSDGSGAYDPRKSVDAKLEINHLPFREGKVFLNSVGMMDNIPYSYNITFYGNTVNLKTLFGEDKLETLSFIDNFTHEWNNTNVKSGFQSGLNFTVGSTTYISPIVYPLITSEKRLFYDSGPQGQSHDFSGNLYYHTNHTHTNTGLAYTDLKPAIKVEMLLEAIQQKYGIEFTDDFFGRGIIASTLSNIKGLYLWLSREKGNIGSGGDDAEYVLQNFSYSSGDSFSTYYKPTSFVDYAGNTNSNLDFETIDNEYDSSLGLSISTKYEFELTVTQTSGDDYDIRIIDVNDNNKIKHEFTELNGNQTLTYGTDLGVVRDRNYQIILSSTSSFVGSASLEIKQRVYRKNRQQYNELDSYRRTTVYNSSTITPILNIVPTERIPEMKVYDFLSGLFKMFNLVAYYIEDLNDADYGKIKVIPLNDFYADNPKTYDITEYVDSSKATVEPAIPYSDIKFTYEEPKTLLMLQHREAFNEVFGDSIYTPQGVDRGQKYEIKVPFAHMKFERLFDEDNDNVTDIQWGYSAGDNFKPDDTDDPPTANYDSVLTKPLLFYAVKETVTVNNSIAWLTPSYTYVQSWIMPMNSFRQAFTQEDPLQTGTATSTSSFRLIDTQYSTIFSAVEAGDITYNTTDGGSAKVLEVVSGTELLLDTDIFTSGDGYKISSPPKDSLNFDIEFDEWTRENFGTESQTLFSEYYQSYIEGVFNPRSRMFKLTAHLPSKILLNYRLNDRFQVGDRVFIINSISTNLRTGESQLELLNIL